MSQARRRRSASVPRISPAAADEDESSFDLSSATIIDLDLITSEEEANLRVMRRARRGQSLGGALYVGRGVEGSGTETALLSPRIGEP